MPAGAAARAGRGAPRRSHLITPRSAALIPGFGACVSSVCPPVVCVQADQRDLTASDDEWQHMPVQKVRAGGVQALPLAAGGCGATWGSGSGTCSQDHSIVSPTDCKHTVPRHSFAEVVDGAESAAL